MNDGRTHHSVTRRLLLGCVYAFALLCVGFAVARYHAFFTGGWFDRITGSLLAGLRTIPWWLLPLVGLAIVLGWLALAWHCRTAQNRPGFPVLSRDDAET